MLNCILIGPTQGLALALQGMCGELREVFVYKALDHYPGQADLGRLLNVVDPEVLLLEIGPDDRSLETARDLAEMRPQAVVIGFTRQRDRGRFAAAGKLGIREMLVAPFTVEDLRQALLRCFHQKTLPVLPGLVAFLPSKPGSGASTVALNVAGVLASQAGQRVLLMDGDRQAGSLAALLKLEPRHSVMEALENSHDLNDGTWSYRNLEARGFDLLPMPPRRTANDPPPWCYHRLLQFVHDRYDTVIVDLPHVMEAGQDAFVRQAAAIYIVCTPEPASLAQTRRRAEELCALGVGTDRLSVVLNRRMEQDQETNQVEKLLALPVCGVLPYDYASVRQAALAGGLIPEKTELGGACSWLAFKIAGLPQPEAMASASSGGLRSLFRKRVLQAV
jgi:pilus assembly protein CpaE